MPPCFHRPCLLIHSGPTSRPAPRPASRTASHRTLLAAWLVVLGATTAVHAADTSPAQQLDKWSAQAGTAGQAAKGRQFFDSRHGGELSCSSCHGTPPTTQGQHASTGKRIAPLAPAFNPKTFTDTAQVDKWFRRNCKDVLSRECSAVEKADVLAYLLSLKP